MQVQQTEQQASKIIVQNNSNLLFVESFRDVLNIFKNLPNRIQTLNELKALIMQRAFRLPQLASFGFTFANEQNIITVYSDDAYIAFVASVIYELKQKNFL